MAPTPSASDSPSADGQTARFAWLARAARLAFWVGIIAVVALSLWPKLDIGAGDSITDKVGHALAYAALALAGAFAFLGPTARRNLTLGLLLLGAGMELAQIAVPGRTTSLADMAANAVGIVLGLAVATAAHAWLRRPDRTLADSVAPGGKSGER